MPERLVPRIRVRCRVEGDEVAVGVFLRHPMETGLRAGSGGRLVPVHIITDLLVSVSGRMVFGAHLGTAIAANPYFHFTFIRRRNDETIGVCWVDDHGNHACELTPIAAQS